jgi:flagellar assembly factor FliW
MDSVDTYGATPARLRKAYRAPGAQSPAEAPAGPPAARDELAQGLADDALETRFGPVPLDPDRQIRFRGGLPGFPEVEWFQLDPIPGLTSELLILQAVDAPGIGFITLPLPDDVPVLRDSDLADVSRMLDIAPGELMILAIVTLAAGQGEIEKYLNLRAPLFIDTRRKLGAQVVLADASYPLRYRFEATGD